MQLPAGTAAALDLVEGLHLQTVVRQSRWCLSGGRRAAVVSSAASRIGGDTKGRKYYENAGENLQKNLVG